MADEEAPPLPSEFAAEIAEDVEMDDGTAIRKMLAIISDQLDTLVNVCIDCIPDKDDATRAKMH